MIPYTYRTSGWTDQLISYNGQSITYDSNGNALTWRDGLAFTWSNGRKLASVSKNGTSVASYTYDAFGTRATKVVNGVTTTFYYVDDVLYMQDDGTNRIWYYYDATGTRIAMECNGIMSYYIYNLQGDVIGLYNSAGQMVARYTYDSWGNPLTITAANGADVSGMPMHLANMNPFRYRGYYYDVETGLYYVSSRYYDPEIGRWINADSVIAGVGGSIQGYNMFAYCFNNPVNMSDSSGHWPQWVKDAANWVNNNIIQPVANFFSPSTNTISGQFQDGIFRGSGSLTGGYSEFNWRLDDKIKSSGSQDGWVGGFGKASVGNANGKIGIGNDNLSASLKGVADGLVATAQAGLHYKDGFGVGAKAKASVLSGRATTEFNIFGWQVELGVSGDVLSVGAEATIGIFPTDDGGKQFDARCNVGAGWFGWGYVVRVKAPA